MEEYLEFCRNIKNLNRQHFTREKGQVPMKGHHIIPKSEGGTGDPDDWTDPNIVPFTPSENYRAHILQLTAYPENKSVLIDVIKMKAGMFETPEEFEEYVIKLYDKFSIFYC
jgi:hypothetical protein